MEKRRACTACTSAKTSANLKTFIDDILDMVEATRGGIIHTKGMNPSPLYWRVGRIIRQAKERSTSGSKIYTLISQNLVPSYGCEFDADALKKYDLFVERFPEYEKIVTLCKDLAWEHFEQLMNLDDPVQRDFYAWMTVIKKWTARELTARIRSNTFEKTADAQREELGPATLPETDDYESTLMKALVSRDPNLMTFLGFDED